MTMPNKRDFRWLRAIPLWVGLMSGSLALLREVAGTFFPSKVPENKLFELCGWGAFFVCGVWAWWIEHGSCKELSAEIERLNEEQKNTVPMLSIVVYEALLETRFGYNDLFVNAEIDNQRFAAPSLVTSYVATLEVGEHRYTNAVPLHDLNEYQSVCAEEITDEYGNPDMEYCNHETLKDLPGSIDHEHPVVANLPHKGWLHFRIDAPAWPTVEISTGRQVWMPSLCNSEGKEVAPEGYQEETRRVPNTSAAKYLILTIKVPRGNGASSISGISHEGHRRIIKASPKSLDA